MLAPALALLVGQLGCLVVTVADGSGAVLQGVEVAFVSGAAAALPPPAFTDEVGRARFCALPAGDYEIRASLDGFLARRTAVNVASTGDTELRVQLGWEEEPTYLPDRTRELDAKLQFQIVVAAWAGSAARDCGDLAPGPQALPALDCARDALRDGTPFYLFEPRRGVDSIVIDGLASRGRQDSRFFSFDSLAASASAQENLKRIRQRPCAFPELVDESEQRIRCPYPDN